MIFQVHSSGQSNVKTVLEILGHSTGQATLKLKDSSHKSAKKLRKKKTFKTFLKQNYLSLFSPVQP